MWGITGLRVAVLTERRHIELHDRPGPVARLIARLRCETIDSRLLSGEAPGESEEGTARLQYMLGREYRSRIAGELRRLTRRARVPQQPGRWAPSIPVQRKEVLRSEPLILTLADELERLEDVSARGVILTSRLLHDGRSPVFWQRSDMELDRAVKHARAALHLG